MSGETFAVDPRGMLTVRGTTTTLLPYAIEITDRGRAVKWAQVLSGARYHRLCVGNKPVTLGDDPGDAGA